MNPYEIHKCLINTYILQRNGDTALLKRDVSKDKRDIDILRENHKFLWGNETPSSWEEELAKKYYDKLFREYCICDLTYYKHNKVALRWRVEKEVIDGKGQFSCAEKHCFMKESLRSWEVNFCYIEDSTKKNALVKIRLCPDCSTKLNYRTKKREVKRLKKNMKELRHMKKTKQTLAESVNEPGTSEEVEIPQEENENREETKEENNAWLKPVEINEKTREEEIDDYLSNLLF